MNVAITGWGILSPLGITRESFAESVRAGRSGIAPIEAFDASAYASRTAAMIRETVDYKHYIPAAHLRRMDQFSRQMVYVACDAFHHAGLADREIPAERRAVVVASGMNHTESIEAFFLSLIEEGPDGANPILFPSTIPNSGGGLIAIELDCRGPNLTITQKETSAEMALILATDLLEQNEADVVLVAAGEGLTPAVFDGLSQLHTLSRAGNGHNEGMWPFSRRRNGFVAGEGSAAVVLERAEEASQAGRESLGRVVGAGECSQPTSPIKYPSDPLPLAYVVEEIAKREKRHPEEIAFISSAANSTRSLDTCDAHSISEIEQRLELDSGSTPVAAFKAATGEFCAGGLTRILAGLLALGAGCCPPLPFRATDYDSEFPHLSLPFLDKPVEISGKDFIHLASAAGGHQAALWLARP